MLLRRRHVGERWREVLEQGAPPALPALGGDDDVAGDTERECREAGGVFDASFADRLDDDHGDVLRNVGGERGVTRAPEREGTHARDELGVTETLRARPYQAAFASAGSFAAGAAVPLVAAAVAPPQAIVPIVILTALVCLAALGGLAARTGGAPLIAGIVRVLFWGALAMALTAGVGALFGTVV